MLRARFTINDNKLTLGLSPDPEAAPTGCGGDTIILRGFIRVLPAVGGLRILQLSHFLIRLFSALVHLRRGLVICRILPPILIDQHDGIISAIGIDVDTGIDPDGPAADQGFQTGDIILDVGGKAVANVSDLRSALTEAKAQGKHNVLMRVKSGGSLHFVAVPLAKG